MEALVQAVSTEEEQLTVRKEDFEIFWPDVFLNEPRTISEWSRFFDSHDGPRFRHDPHCLFSFRQDPLDPASGRGFIWRRDQSSRHFLAIGSPEVFGEMLFTKQAEMLPAGFRVASAVEAVGTIFAFKRQNGFYPATGWLEFWCDDIIPVEWWPIFFRQRGPSGFSGIQRDHRVYLRIDPNHGIIIGHADQNYCSKHLVIAATQD